MKSSFKFAKRVEVDTEENVLPLINIVFLLLIFFLVAGAITIPELFYVEPPISDSETSVLPTETTVLINEDGQISFQNELIELNELHALATKIINEDSLQTFKLKVDAYVGSGKAIEAMEILRNAGVRKTLLITTKEG
ncbi:MAG: biopolymer transporter ExbD [Pseudomonadota bacterium]